MSQGSGEGSHSFCFNYGGHNSLNPGKLKPVLHQPFHIHNFEVSQGGSNRSLKNYAFISNAVFKNCMYAHKSLSNETIIIWDCWIRNTDVCMKTGRVFGIHCWLSVWREPCQRFFSQYRVHLLRKPMRTDLQLCDRLQTSAQACTCFFKKWQTKQGYKQH